MLENDLLILTKSKLYELIRANNKRLRRIAMASAPVEEMGCYTKYRELVASNEAMLDVIRARSICGLNDMDQQLIVSAEKWKLKAKLMLDIRLGN